MAFVKYKDGRDGNLSDHHSDHQFVPQSAIKKSSVVASGSAAVKETEDDDDVNGNVKTKTTKTKSRVIRKQ